MRIRSAWTGALLALAVGGCGTGVGAERAPNTASIASVSTAAVGQTATADLVDAAGAPVGRVKLTQGAVGVLIQMDLKGLKPGVHAFHLHAKGRCDRPDFTSAGGHYNPRSHEHGFLNPEGPHAGDLPNIHVPADGTVKAEFHTSRVTLGTGVGTLFDADGTAIVIHAGADDYKTDPAGHAGARVACGVVRK